MDSGLSDLDSCREIYSGIGDFDSGIGDLDSGTGDLDSGIGDLDSVDLDAGLEIAC